MRINEITGFNVHQNYHRINSVIKDVPDNNNDDNKVSDSHHVKNDKNLQQDNIEPDVNRAAITHDELLDVAIKRDFAADKDLIGSAGSLENLDVKKAISGMEKDRILMEYQTFVRNPETEDGIVRKLN